MTVAAHITESDSENDWMFRQLVILAQLHPNDRFVFIYDNPDYIQQKDSGNIQSLALLPIIKNRLLRHFWYQYKLPALLQRINPNVFVCNDSVCVLNSKYKQVLVFNQYTKKGRKSITKKPNQLGVRFLRKYLTAAQLLLCFDRSVQEAIQEILPQKQLPVQIIHPGFDSIRNISDEQIAETKSRISDGSEYFLMPVTIHSLPLVMIVVKAFSAFKKRQKSEMKLVLQLLESQIEKSLPNFMNYKYRSDLLIVKPENKQDYFLQLASAYTCVYISEQQNVAREAFDIVAMQVPLVCAVVNISRTYFEDAVIYCEPEISAIAEKLMDVYRNEKSRNALLSRAAEFVLQNSPEKTAGKLWVCLEETAA